MLQEAGRLRVIIIASLNCVVYKVQYKCCVKTVAVELWTLVEMTER